VSLSELIQLGRFSSRTFFDSCRIDQERKEHHL
jgi:hypothetical protein